MPGRNKNRPILRNKVPCRQVPSTQTDRLNSVTRTETFFSLFTRIRPGEGRGIVLLGINGFLLVCAYYILKTLRESMILTEFDAETKAYAVAATAVVLFFLVPLYGVLFRNTNRTQLVFTINGFFVVNLAMFYLAMQLGISVAFQYYIWIGVFGVMVVAQFWAYLTDIYNVRSGQRVFPLIMIATSLGGLAGAQIASLTFPLFGTYGLLFNPKTGRFSGTAPHRRALNQWTSKSRQATSST